MEALMENYVVNVRMNLHKGIVNRRHRLRRSLGWMCVTVFAIATLALGVANGQLTGKGAITGTVTDKTGAMVVNASISARNDATGITTTTETTGAGDYNFPNLDPGIYTVVTTAQGFEKLAQQNVHVNAMESQAYNPVLTVGGSSVEITVTTELPQLETSNASLGATMESDVYSELPIEMGAYGAADQRRASDFVYLMPGVQGNETNGNATTNTGVINGSGSRGAASDVYIDGVPFVRAGGNGDPRFVWTAMSVDAVDQFQVQTTGYSAVYEGQGVMNYTIKQGGAKQHASVYEFLRNTEFDTWGWNGKYVNQATGKILKPVEHSNEYGINLSGPLIPLGKWKQKVFYFGNYNGFRYTSANPTQLTFPTPNQQIGNFTASGTYVAGTDTAIYDPTSQAACTAHNTNSYPCRYQFGFTAPAAGVVGANGAGVQTSAINVIPNTKWSNVAKNLQSFLPATGISSTLQNNYTSANATGLINWSTTDRIDFLPTSSDTLTFIFADGRQASSIPVGQTATTGTSARGVGPIPYNYGQAYAPKTAVGIIEETHVFTPHLINQLKWGYARYNGPAFDADQLPQYAASKWMSNLPVGPAQDAFPFVTFAGTNNQTQWSGYTPNVTLSENYTVLDNLQWTVGKHSFTFGGQVAWLLYNTISATGGSTPITLANAVTETAGITGTSTTAFTVNSGQGLSYASFLMGEIDKGSFTNYSYHPGYGARFRAISPYIQDNWKITPKMTFDLGLRYDFYPSVREVKDDASFFDPNLTNPVTGLPGALNYAGHGAGTCNCDTPVKNYYRNIAPRLGMAYQLNSKTVIRSSWGVMYSHGDAVGGLAYTLGTLGFSAAPSFSSSQSVTTMTNLLAGGSGAVPAWSAASGVASGNGYGTGYTTSISAAPSGSNYDDPYLGGRAPEYINWSLGLQRQVSNALAVSATYVGSEGHFLQADSNSGRGFQSNGLDPKYLYLGSHLTDKTLVSINSDCTTYSLGCNATALNEFAVAQGLSTFLKPYPFESPSDSFGYISNSNYHALQAMANMRAWHGLTVNTNYAYSRIIDDGGYFRSGYAIPAGTLANHPTQSWKADRIERTVSTSNQKHHFVATTVWDWPLGKTVLSSQAMERAILGGFKFSGIFQAFSGSPLFITESSVQTNPAQPSSNVEPIMNPNFSGSARQNGKWGKGTTTDTTIAQPSYIVPSTGTTTANAAGPFMNPVTTMLSSYAYQFSDAPRTAPYNLTGPGNYQLDLGMVRSFPLHLTAASKLNIRAEWYNVTNKTFFALSSTAVGNTSFGTVTTSSLYNRKAAQFSARIEF
jgi:hypothetical protein